MLSDKNIEALTEDLRERYWRQNFIRISIGHVPFVRCITSPADPLPLPDRHDTLWFNFPFFGRIFKFYVTREYLRMLKELDVVVPREKFSKSDIWKIAGGVILVLGVGICIVTKSALWTTAVTFIQSVLFTLLRQHAEHSVDNNIKVKSEGRPRVPVHRPKFVIPRKKPRFKVRIPHQTRAIVISLEAYERTENLIHKIKEALPQKVRDMKGIILDKFL